MLCRETAVSFHTSESPELRRVHLHEDELADILEFRNKSDQPGFTESFASCVSRALRAMAQREARAR